MPTPAGSPSPSCSPASPFPDPLDAVLDHLLLFQSDGNAFAQVRVRGGVETWPVRSRAFKRWLTFRLHEVREAVPARRQVRDLQALLEAQALLHGPERPAWGERFWEGELLLHLGQELLARGPDPCWSGTEAELLERLRALFPDEPTIARWRKRPGRLTRALRRHEESLAAAGVDVRLMGAGGASRQILLGNAARMEAEQPTELEAELELPGEDGAPPESSPEPPSAAPAMT